MTWYQSSHCSDRGQLARRAGVALLALGFAMGCGGPSDSNRPDDSMGSGAVAGVGAGASGATGGAGGAGGAAPAGGAGGTSAGSAGSAGSAQAGAPNLEPVIPYKAIHRLSNTEYDNTMHDLLGTDARLGEAVVAE